MGGTTGPAKGMERYLVRVGHDEREACVGELLEQHVAGRLSAEELDRRQQAAMEAVTMADLERLVADLPVHRTGRRAAVRHPLRRTRGRSRARWAVPPAAVLFTGTFLGSASAWSGSDATVAAALVTGAAGVATGWWAGRRPD